MPSTVHVTKLTRNVSKEHVEEIFGNFGKIKNIDFGCASTWHVIRYLYDIFRWDSKVNLPKGFAYVEYEKPEGAQQAIEFMDAVSILYQTPRLCIAVSN